MSFYNLINPNIKDISFVVKNIDEFSGAKKIWKKLTKFIELDVSQFYFSIKQIGGNVIDYKVTKNKLEKIKEKKSKYCFACMVIVNDNYIFGALVLGFSIRQCGSFADLVVMVTPDITEKGKKQLKLIFDKVIDIDYIEKDIKMKKWKRFEERYKWITKSFTKFNVLKLTEYKKVALLDVDMLVVQNPDDIFKYDTPAGICTEINPKDDLKWKNKLIPAEMVKKSLLTGYGIRGCSYLFTPSDKDYKKIIDDLSKEKTYGDEKSFSGPDEQFITNFYVNSWHALDSKYGVTAWKTNELPEKPVILHFVSEKPWMEIKEWDDFKLWYRVAKKMIDTIPETKKSAIPELIKKLETFHSIQKGGLNKIIYKPKIYNVDNIKIPTFKGNYLFKIKL
jgi:hypothetical protein